MAKFPTSYWRKENLLFEVKHQVEEVDGFRKLLRSIHSVSEYKKRYTRNSTQILENLRNAVLGFFGLRNKFVNVQWNKKHSTQNVFKLENRKKIHALAEFTMSTWLAAKFVDSMKDQAGTLEQLNITTPS